MLLPESVEVCQNRWTAGIKKTEFVANYFVYSREAPLKHLFRSAGCLLWCLCEIDWHMRTKRFGTNRRSADCRCSAGIFFYSAQTGTIEGPLLYYDASRTTIPPYILEHPNIKQPVLSINTQHNLSIEPYGLLLLSEPVDAGQNRCTIGKKRPNSSPSTWYTG